MLKTRPNPPGAKQAAEKLLFEGVILSAAKDLLFAPVESKADPSVAQNRRGLRMTLLRVLQQLVRPTFGSWTDCLKPCSFKDQE
jgi:hypothetical protein